MTKVPAVLIVAFNRPVHAQRVLAQVRLAKPEKLYVAVDGPRAHRTDDAANVAKTLAVFDNVDWRCDVKRLVRNKNLGCKRGVASAVSWFFEHEEQGVVLEDDCLPSPSFFSFAAHLLERYKHEDSVMHINAVNFQDGCLRSNRSYYFSKISHVWGWASWRRAWRKYDMEMQGLEDFFDGGGYKSVINHPGAYGYWRRMLFATKRGEVDTWDYQWAYSIWKANGLCITPEKNLIENIGFGEEATHTKVRSDKYGSMKVETLNGYDRDVALLIPNYIADRYTFSKHFTNPPLMQKILPYVKRKLSFFLH